jgi:hypothetical protein
VGICQMRIFGNSKPRRIVVRQYGRDSFLGLISPFMTFALLGGTGRPRRPGPPDRVIENMEEDAIEMTAKGYRVVASHQYERPALGISYVKVTYELVDPPD